MPKVAVCKSIVIEVPIERVYADVRNFKEWRAWSPWLITEPECQVTYADDGKQYAWEGDVVGSGEMEIVSEDSPNRIDYELTFLKPFKSRAGVAMSFAEKGSGTELTWSMDSSLPFFLFFMRPMMTAIIGMDYTRGLSMLKDKLETGSVPSQLAFPGEESVSALPYLGIRTECSISEIGPVMERDLGKLRDSGTASAGNPFSIYHQWNPTKGTADYTIAIPLESALSEASEGFVLGKRPACRVFPIKHTGPYRHLGNAWSAGVNRARNKVFLQSKKVAPFEVYENEPGKVDDEALVTTVYFPLR